MMTPSPLKIAFYIGPVAIHWYGIIIALALLVGIIVACREVKREHLDLDDFLTMLLWMIPCGIIGGRAYYVIFRWDYYALHPGDIIAIWKGGTTIFGVVLGGIAAILIYCAVKKLTYLRWIDLCMPALILAQGIGRWGNYVNAEAYGPVIADGSFWSWVPFQVWVDGLPHHPIFLYESIWDILVFVFLMLLIRRPHRIGSVFASYLILYSAARFFIETLRNDSIMLGQFRLAMIVTAIAFVLGWVLLFLLRRRDKVDVSALPEKNRAVSRQQQREKQRKQKRK